MNPKLYSLADFFEGLSLFFQGDTSPELKTIIPVVDDLN